MFINYLSINISFSNIKIKIFKIKKLNFNNYINYIYFLTKIIFKIDYIIFVK